MEKINNIIHSPQKNKGKEKKQQYKSKDVLDTSYNMSEDSQSKHQISRSALRKRSILKTDNKEF